MRLLHRARLRPSRRAIDRAHRRVRMDLSGDAHMDVCLTPDTVAALRALGEAAAARMREDSSNAVTPGRVRRVLRSGDPRGDDYRAAEEWVKDIRSRLAQIRGELEDIGRIEASLPHDRLCTNVAGSLTLSLIALHGLVDDGSRSFGNRAARTDELWDDVAANADAYVIEDGATWEWRPWGIFKRPSRGAS